MAKTAVKLPLETQIMPYVTRLGAILVKTIDSAPQEREKEKGEGTISVPTNNPSAAGTLPEIRQVFRDLRNEFGEEILENLEDGGSCFISSPEDAERIANEKAAKQAEYDNLKQALAKVQDELKALETGRNKEQWGIDEFLRMAMVARLKNTSAIEHTALTPWALIGVEPPKAPPRGKPAGSGKKAKNSDSNDHDQVPLTVDV